MKATDMSNRQVEAAQRAVQWMIYWDILRKAGAGNLRYFENKIDRAIKDLTGELVPQDNYRVPAVFCDWCGKPLSGNSIRIYGDYSFCGEICKEKHRKEFKN